MLRQLPAPRTNFRPLLLGLAAASMVGAAVPVAWAQPVASPAPVAAATVAPVGDAGVTADSLRSAVGKDKAERIEARIAHLHETLRITPAQEPLWQAFTAVMRQNVVQMDAVSAKRQGSVGTMDAVQNLQSYGEFEETNARNVQQLLPPFQALYSSFSGSQKKTADTTFQHYTERAVKKSG